LSLKSTWLGSSLYTCFKDAVPSLAAIIFNMATSHLFISTILPLSNALHAANAEITRRRVAKERVGGDDGLALPLKNGRVQRSVCIVLFGGLLSFLLFFSLK
jgi:hypothetical protein